MTQPPQGPPWQPQQPYPPQQQWGPPPSYPHNPAPPPPPKPRFGLGAKIGLGVLALFLIGSIGQAAGGDDPAPATDTASNAAAPAPQGPDRPAAAPAFVGANPEDLATTPGSPLTADDLTVTADELRDGSSTFGATVCTTVTYLNDSGDTARFGPFDWTLQNPSGAVLNITFFGGADSQLSSGELAPGGTVTGDLCFEDANPSTGDYLVLYETPGLFNTQRLAWINPR